MSNYKHVKNITGVEIVHERYLQADFSKVEISNNKFDFEAYFIAWYGNLNMINKRLRSFSSNLDNFKNNTFLGNLNALSTTWVFEFSSLIYLLGFKRAKLAKINPNLDHGKVFSTDSTDFDQINPKIYFKKLASIKCS